MRTNRRWRWSVLGVAAFVVLAGCGDGGGAGDEVGVARPPTEPTTTTVPVLVTNSTVAQPTATTTPTTVALPEPVFVGGIPQVTVTPTRGTVGTRVEVDGYGFEGRWQAGGPLWLSNSADETCGLLAEVDEDLLLGTDGHLTGSFVVPETGVCRSSPGSAINVAGNRLDILYRCDTDCRIGTFTVILPGESTEEPTGTECEGYVVFGRGEDLAGDIYADGLSCEEAKAFLQAHAQPTGAMNGAAHIEAEGFSCDRTGQSDRYLPRSNYKCTSGDQAIFFIRT